MLWPPFIAKRIWIIMKPVILCGMSTYGVCFHVSMLIFVLYSICVHWIGQPRIWYQSHQQMTFISQPSPLLFEVLSPWQLCRPHFRQTLGTAPSHTDGLRNVPLISGYWEGSLENVLTEVCLKKVLDLVVCLCCCI